jgi:hypothetical protein
MAGTAKAAPEVSSANTMLRLIYYDNLKTTDDANHISEILVESVVPTCCHVETDLCSCRL